MDGPRARCAAWWWADMATLRARSPRSERERFDPRPSIRTGLIRDHLRDSTGRRGGRCRCDCSEPRCRFRSRSRCDCKSRQRTARYSNPEHVPRRVCRVVLELDPRPRGGGGIHFPHRPERYDRGDLGIEQLLVTDGGGQRTWGSRDHRAGHHDSGRCD